MVLIPCRVKENVAAVVNGGKLATGQRLDEIRPAVRFAAYDHIKGNAGLPQLLLEADKAQVNSR